MTFYKYKYVVKLLEPIPKEYVVLFMCWEINFVLIF